MKLLGLKNYKDLWNLDESNPSDAGSDYIPAFFNLDLEDRDAVKKWIETAIPILENRAVDFTKKALENIMFYKGSQEANLHHKTIEDIHRYYATNKVSLNICYELVEEWVNRISQQKSQLSAIPVNNDASAKQNAEAKELILKDYFTRNKVDTKFVDWRRQAYSVGESYMYFFWNPNKGPIVS